MSATVERVAKPLRRVELKSGSRGEVDAVFATLNAIDADSDVTLPGAFEDGAEVVVGAWGHKSWTGKLPVGVGRIGYAGDEVVLRAQFFMDVPEARDTFAVLQKLGPLAQWSYGYDAVDFSFGEFMGKRVRFLKRLKVHEVSPLLQGAGVNTRTLSSKADDEAAREFMRFVALQHNIDVTAASDELARQYVRFVALSRSGGNG